MISAAHISNQRKDSYAIALENIPSRVTRSIPCKNCKRYFFIDKKQNGDIVECPECHSVHVVRQRIEIKTSVELVQG